MILPLLKNQLTLRVEEPTVFRQAMTRLLLESNPWLSKRAALDILDDGIFTGPKGRFFDNTWLVQGMYEVTLDPNSALRASMDYLRPNADQNSLKILYECSDFWILSKRSGQPSLPLRLWDQGSVVQDALQVDPNLALAFETRLELGAVHRLDHGTSGCFLFARNQMALKALRAMFASREVSKFYTAWCYLPEGSGQPPRLITDPIVHLKKTNKRMALARLTHSGEQRGDHPLSAHTQILDLIRINKDVVRVEVQIETGVRHQIRVHLASIGMPLVGDSTYDRQLNARLPQAKRLGLHASRIGFHWEGKDVLVASEELKLEDLF